MSIELEPSTQLGFRTIKETLVIRNPTQLPIAFKIKTTAPKQYCVRPNSGRVEPGGELEVQVQMQAMKEDPAIDFKCKDKFLVQSVAITAEREQLNADLWPTVERDAKDQIREKKIRCVFLPSVEHEITQIKEEDELNSSRSSSVAHSTHNTINAQSTEVPVSTTSVAEINVLKRELQSAQETIQKLQSEASTLRQRKPEVASTSAPVMTSVNLKHQQEGYPITYVAGAAVVAFLFAYIFF
ncbi:phosphatidylinositol-binding protein scs2 [Entomortierella beljakovae]|nr:phosphatidylinositol-binding protein scs2 [Entomortierella beljakovae]